MHLLHSEVIRWFRGQGVKRYDFVGIRVGSPGGSEREGSKIFNKRFGGRFVDAYMWKFPMPRHAFLSYNVAVRLRTGGDIVDQAKSLARAMDQGARQSHALGDCVGSGACST